MKKSMPQEIQQVLKGLALNRQPGWHFPGNFLDMSVDELGADGVRLTVDPGRHCSDTDGQTNMSVVGMLADIGMAVAIRKHVDFAVRMATVSMTLQFTGAPRIGLLEARGRFDGFYRDLSGQQGLSRAEIFSDGTLLCTVSGSFLVLDKSDGLQPMPMRRHGAVDSAGTLLSTEALTDQEQVVYRRACEALGPGPGSFIERFWGFLPQKQEQGASCDFVNGLHVGNRVGHTQGGITVALAALTASAALGTDWCLVGLSSWYIRPGTGPMLHATANIIHQGSFTAVVQVSISDDAGGAVLIALSNHSRAVE
ncbi:hypothetical protein [Paralcaligenes ureilyticus]|uniref:Acyl-coenzyme A thioesterase PaaI-like protein n=1 Tax=Paralcaligenes ureilyticus TaxID=627131 RepID=A0A4R3MC93_9BURK|nr:hypothetical protein [Paralcaligenes ureilyticus]TCT09607.1 acyl-coenzyme A thioesterase PaaI-like protein [Paralcaligenes ureilyticus]